jgi:LysE type translocator
MFGIHDFALFITTGILLNLTPGPDTLYILGRSIAHGRRAGVASALDICVGSIFHTGAAALGLSAFLATSAWGFTFVKLAGAAYLIFLGVRALLERQLELSMPAHFRQRGGAAAFQQGNPDKCAESESRVVLPCVPAAVVVCQRVQRPVAREPHGYRAAQSRRRLALYFSWSAISGRRAKIESRM